MKLSEAVAFVRQTKPAWSEGKGKQTAYINSNHVLTVLGGDTLMEDITAMDYVRIQQHFKAEGKTNGTINRITSALSTVFSELLKHQLIDKVVRCPNKLSEPKGRLVVYTVEETQALLKAALALRCDEAQLIHDIIFAALKTGARQGELLKLTWEDVDFDLNEVCFVDTKRGDDRVIPMSPSLREMLARLHDERIDDAEVFPISKDVLIRRFRRVLKSAGITDKRKCFHTLRHFVATELFQRGAPLTDVQAVLGHSQVNTTMRYSHSTKEGKQKAILTIDQL